jgi:small GTP-binding protein
VGKTALFRCLKESGKTKGSKTPTTISTDGIDIESWDPDMREEAEENEKVKEGDEETPGIRFSVWDFAGQDIYYSTHQFFLTRDSIFLLVFNLVDPTTLEKVDYWLQSIQNRAPTAPIILVGTHCDSKKCNKDLLLDIEHRVNTVFRPHFPSIRTFISVSCKSKKNIDTLQSMIVRLVREQKIKYYPRAYLQLEDIIKAEKLLRMPPIMTLGEFTSAAKSCGIEESVCKGVAQFLCNLGLVVYWNDGQQRLDDILVLDPQVPSFLHPFSLVGLFLLTPPFFLLVVDKLVCNNHHHEAKFRSGWDALWF